MAARARIRRRGRKIRLAAVLLFLVGRVIVAQAVVQREFAGHLPAVLNIHAPLLIPETRYSRNPDICTVDQAQEKTGVGKSDSGTCNGGRVQVREPRFRGAESVAAIGPQIVIVRISLKAHLRAELISMVVLDPSQADDRGWLLHQCVLLPLYDLAQVLQATLRHTPHPEEIRKRVGLEGPLQTQFFGGVVVRGLSER